MGKFGDREKEAFWGTKAAIFLKRVKIEEKLLWMVYRNSPTLFQAVPYRIFFLGGEGVEGNRECMHSQGLPQLFWLPPINSGAGKVLNAYSQGQSEQNPMKNFGENSRGRSQRVPKIFRAPIYGAHCSVIFAIARLSCLDTSQRQLAEPGAYLGERWGRGYVSPFGDKIRTATRSCRTRKRR